MFSLNLADVWKTSTQESFLLMNDIFFPEWWILFLCWFLVLCCLKRGGSLLFLLNSSCLLEQGMFVKTRSLSSFWRLSILKHQSEVKEESLKSEYSTGLCLPSSLKDRANLSVNLSVLIYNSTPLGFIPAPLPSNWRVNENARATAPTPQPMGNSATETLLLSSLQRISRNAVNWSIPVCQLLVCVNPGARQMLL